MVRVYIADIRDIAGREDALLPLLDAARREKTLAFPPGAARGRCLVGGLLLRQYVGACALSFGPYGKPYVPGRTHFNLSHSGNFAALATADAPVGLDIQICTSRLIRFFPDKDDPTLAWATYESVIKAQGGRVSRDIRDAAPPDGFAVTPLACPEGYRMAVCHAADEPVSSPVPFRYE